MWLLTCSAFYVPQVWKVTLQNTPLFSQCRRGDPGGEGWFKNSSVVRIGLSWVCLALRGNCLWLWLFMEWGWVCLLLSKQKNDKTNKTTKKKHVFRAIPGLVWNVFWEIWGRSFKPTAGLSTTSYKRKKHLRQKNNQGKWAFFFLQRI